MRKNACCFTGHRALSAADAEVLRPALRAEILRLAQRGVYRFYAGGARGFDMLAAETVLEMRKELPVELHLILPCRDQAAKWPGNLRQRYDRILRAADSVVYMADTYDETCMRRRNDALINAAAHCICYLQRETGGTAYTVRQARRAGLEIIHLLTTAPEQMMLED
ncbi:MAG: DUF1273 family protein [Clostridia bacterium]|nr:DUF1273 family protein [Clostridia bacterium]